MPALRILLLLAVAGTVTASPEALKSYKNELKQTRKLDKKFWQEFKGNWRNAYAALDAPLDRAQAKPSLYREAVRDFAQIDDLYSEFAGIGESRGKAAIAFAKSGHDKALEMLFKELLDLAKKIDKLEEELSGSRVSGGRYIFDQRPGIRRHGLGHYEPLLVEALAHAKGAAAFLSSAGMDKAARKDGRNSIVRRVAVLDALGRLPQGEHSDAAKRAILQAYEKGGSSLRVAAVEALGLWGDGGSHFWKAVW